MPLPGPLAHLKREISEKKWAEARQWAGGRTSKKKYRMPKSQSRRVGGWEHQEAHFEVLAVEDWSLPRRAVPTLGEESAHRPVLVVPMPDADPGSPLQRVSRVEAPAES